MASDQKTTYCLFYPKAKKQIQLDLPATAATAPSPQSWVPLAFSPSCSVSLHGDARDAACVKAGRAQTVPGEPVCSRDFVLD